MKSLFSFRQYCSVAAKVSGIPMVNISSTKPMEVPSVLIKSLGGQCCLLGNCQNHMLEMKSSRVCAIKGNCMSFFKMHYLFWIVKLPLSKCRKFRHKIKIRKNAESTCYSNSQENSISSFQEKWSNGTQFTFY